MHLISHSSHEPRYLTVFAFDCNPCARPGCCTFRGNHESLRLAEPLACGSPAVSQYEWTHPSAILRCPSAAEPNLFTFLSAFDSYHNRYFSLRQCFLGPHLSYYLVGTGEEQPEREAGTAVLEPALWLCCSVFSNTFTTEQRFPVCGPRTVSSVQFVSGSGTICTLKIYWF